MSLGLFKATLTDSWKSIVIYGGVLFLWGIMIMSVYPSVEELINDPMAEGEDISLIETGVDDKENKIFNLTWDLKVGAGEHLALGAEMAVTHGIFDDLIMKGKVSVLSSMNFTPEIFENAVSNTSLLEEYRINVLYHGTLNRVQFTRTDNSTYFFVVYLAGGGNYTPVNISAVVSNTELVVSTAFDDYLQNNAFMEGFLGTDNLDFTSPEGFVSIEFFSMWPLFMVIYLGIKAGGSVAPHVEDRSIDILMATGYSRNRFLTEKIGILLLNTAVVLISGFLGLYLGALAVDVTLPMEPLIMAFVTCIPLSVAFMGIALLLTVLMNEGSKCTWGIMAIILGMYVIQIIVNLSDSALADMASYISLFTYWHGTDVMREVAIPVKDFLIPLVLGVLFTGAAYWLFNRKEIPA